MPLFPSPRRCYHKRPSATAVAWWGEEGVIEVEQVEEGVLTVNWLDAVSKMPYYIVSGLGNREQNGCVATHSKGLRCACRSVAIREPNLNIGYDALLPRDACHRRLPERCVSATAAVHSDELSQGEL